MQPQQHKQATRIHLFLSSAASMSCFPSRVGSTMSSLSHDTGMVEVHSQALRTSWKVPAHLIQMPSSSIVLLVTRAALAAGERQQPPSLCVLEDDTAAAPICIESSADDQRELIEQDHDIIVRLAVSHSVVKYWLYLRMFWHCRGGEDRLVRSKIAAIEGIADKGPGVLQRWTRVKKGLALIAMLLNARQTLDALLECRTPSLFDKLIYLHVRHHQVPMIAHLVQQVKTTSAANVTTDWMSKVCQSRELEDLPPRSPNEDEQGEDEDEDDAAEAEDEPPQPAIGARLPSTRSRTAPKTLTFWTTPPQPLPKPKRKAVSHPRPPPVKRLAQSLPRVSQDDEEADQAAVEHEAQTRSSSSSPAPSSRDPLDITAADGHEPRLRSLAEQLHCALVEMHSMPVLEYYHRLLREYPELVHVAAPISYSTQEMYHEAIRHRLEDQCHTRVLLYERDFLLHHSHGLSRMPALMLTRCGDDSATTEPVLSCPMASLDSRTSHATKVWLFFPDLEVDEEDERNHNSRKALAVYHRFHPHLAPQQANAGQGGSVDAVDDDRPSSTLWDTDGGQLLSLPARLLLQAGVHVLLVVQRAGETVSMPGSSPSRYDSPCAHMVHTLPSPTVLSVAGNYCSSQHLLDHIEHQWKRSSSKPLAHGQREEVAVEYPAGVFPVGFPTPSSLSKPTTSWLKRRHHALSKDPARQREARASELDSPDQMLYLLNRQLDAAIALRSAAPPPRVITSLGQLIGTAPTPEGRATVLTLLTKAIAMSTSAAQLQPFRSCSLALGCSAGPLSPPLPRYPEGDSIQVFRFSTAAHQRPLLFVRNTADGDAWAKQQAFAQAQLAMWQRGEPCRYSVTRTGVGGGAPAPAPTVADATEAWQARVDHRRMERPQPIARHHLHPVNSIYLQDVCADSAPVRQQTVAELKSCLPAALVDGGALRWCEMPTDGVHYPSFHMLRSSADALSNYLASAAITDVHNEPQRLGFWHHLLPVEGPTADQREAVSIDRAVLEGIDVQERVKEMYKLFTDMTKLSSAADVWTKDDAAALSPFVSTSYGELTQASVTKVVECMVSHGLHSDDVLFDVGSCYGRALCHVSLVTGIRTCGIEAVLARYSKAMECIAAWDEASTCTRAGRRGLAMDPLSASVELNCGDIMNHLPLLFTATHVMIFDARFQASTRTILQHVWMSLAGRRRRRLRIVLCTTKLRSEPDDNRVFELVAELSVTTGQNNFTMYVYRVLSTMALSPTLGDPVVLAVFPGQRVGLRASRSMDVGERLFPVLGPVLAPGAWDKLRHEACDRRWQWMVRRDGVWMHVLNLARFVNSSCGSDERDGRSAANAHYVKSADGSMHLECSRIISAGEEVVACGQHARDHAVGVCPWSCYTQMRTEAR